MNDLTIERHEIEYKQALLVNHVRACGAVAVAFSGGVDSAVVAKAAYLALGDRAIAVMSVSPSLASGELELARKTAADIGIRFVTIKTLEYLLPDYQQNGRQRCYYCKSELYQTILSLKAETGFEIILNGANADDRGDHRPGMIAAAEYQVKSPLLDLGFTKNEVRELAKAWGLEIWDKPASPCLASRIAYGIEVTVPRLERVDRAELFLQQLLQIKELRVRDLGEDRARIEVPSPETAKVTAADIKQQVVTRFHELGFKTIELSLEGFRSGILNEKGMVQSILLM